MQDLRTALRRLERLQAIVDEYGPIKYESSDRVRQLARDLAEAYGAAEDVYRHYAGDQNVAVVDRQVTKLFRNYFEAGWLSSRSFHDHEGRRELLRVIGRVRAEVEDGREPDTGQAADAVWPLLHPRVREIAEPRFRAGHYADAVEAALKGLSETVRNLVLDTGGPELDGVPLMQLAFSPNKPIIRLADMSTQSGRDMQRGYMDLFVGTMFAIRNPKAHGNVTLSPHRCLHLLFLASTLWGTLEKTR